ncbi:MAG: response regulator [Rhodospirillaceae bacterium]|nr:response regulator [Rhodospirillaceae bacterium]
MNSSTGVHTDFNLSKTTFLVADPKTHFRDMVQSALMSAGAKSVKHATSVEKAVETLNRYGQEINCVICDWDMGPVGGLDLLRMIRSRALPKTAPRTAVVIFTARADSAAVKIAMALDVNGIAVAPLSFEKLVKTISSALTRTWLLQQPAQYAAVPALTQAPQPEPRVHVGKEPIRAQPMAGRPSGAPDSVPKPRPAANELKNVHMCCLSDVKAGEILARDLRDKEGHLLLSTGAVLKPTILERLKGVAGGHADSYHVWVGERDDARI